MGFTPISSLSSLRRASSSVSSGSTCPRGKLHRLGSVAIFELQNTAPFGKRSSAEVGIPVARTLIVSVDMDVLFSAESDVTMMVLLGESH